MKVKFSNRKDESNFNMSYLCSFIKQINNFMFTFLTFFARLCHSLFLSAFEAETETLLDIIYCRTNRRAQSPQNVKSIYY